MLRIVVAALVLANLLFFVWVRGWLAPGLPPPRQATLTDFREHDPAAPGTVLDRGIALYFAGPHSFTGEDVAELQGHGGPVVLDLLLQSVLRHGARLARPGEFSERAFLNGKIDLAQAEAIADLIDSSTAHAARNAMRSLQGAFSERIHELLRELVSLRVFVEASIDFPEEEVDFLADAQVAKRLETLLVQLASVRETARNGVLVREGMTLVPIRMYFNDRGMVKLKLGVAKGKKLADKRETSAKRDWDRQKARLLKQGS